jgi:hypothetical protein
MTGDGNRGTVDGNNDLPDFANLAGLTSLSFCLAIIFPVLSCDGN